VVVNTSHNIVKLWLNTVSPKLNPPNWLFLVKATLVKKRQVADRLPPQFTRPRGLDYRKI
jgi:hypothetical protein